MGQMRLSMNTSNNLRFRYPKAKNIRAQVDILAGHFANIVSRMVEALLGFNIGGMLALNQVEF